MTSTQTAKKAGPEPGEEPPTVAVAMARVMAGVTVVRKDQVNTTPGQGGYKFRGIDAVVNALGPVMREHGLVVMPAGVLSSEQREVVVGQKQSRMTHSVVHVRYALIGPAGDQLTGESVGEAFDSGDKSMAKAMSVSLRTFLLQAFMLPTDEPDPDEHSYELSDRQEDEQRRALPPSRPAERSRGREQPAPPPEDPWVPLNAVGKEFLDQALAASDPWQVKAIYKAAQAAVGLAGAKVIEQMVKPSDLDDIVSDAAKTVGLTVDLPLWEVLTRIGTFVGEQHKSVLEAATGGQA